MGLNIKNPETYRLVEELAKRTGESMTAAVTIAVRERLDRLRSEQGRALPSGCCGSARTAPSASSPTAPRAMMRCSMMIAASPDDYRYLCDCRDPAR